MYFHCLAVIVLVERVRPIRNFIFAFILSLYGVKTAHAQRIILQLQQGARGQNIENNAG